MEEKQIPFSRLSDIYGFRIVTEDEAACYAAMGAVHKKMRVIPGRMKDYISGPKSNGYRSIHTTVSGPGASRVEIQIRTRDMHEGRRKRRRSALVLQGWGTVAEPFRGLSHRIGCRACWRGSKRAIPRQSLWNR